MGTASAGSPAAGDARSGARRARRRRRGGEARARRRRTGRGSGSDLEELLKKPPEPPPQQQQQQPQQNQQQKEQQQQQQKQQPQIRPRIRNPSPRPAADPPPKPKPPEKANTGETQKIGGQPPTAGRPSRPLAGPAHPEARPAPQPGFARRAFPDARQPRTQTPPQERPRLVKPAHVPSPPSRFRSCWRWPPAPRWPSASTGSPAPARSPTTRSASSSWCLKTASPTATRSSPSVDGLEMQYTGTGSTFLDGEHERHPEADPQLRRAAHQAARGAHPRVRRRDRQGHPTCRRRDLRHRQRHRRPERHSARDGRSVAKLAPAGGAFWAGEVFPVTYTLDIAQRFRPRPPGPVVWKPAPLTVEDWAPAGAVRDRPPAASRASGSSTRPAATSPPPGNYRIPAATQEVVLVVDTSGNLFSFPFSAPEMVQHTVTSNEPALTIKPLPDGAPADFGGAVGQFTFTSKVVPTSVAVGEPITWTLELGGTGNWPDIHGLPAREVSKDFKVLQPQAKRTPAEGKLFDATLTEDVVLIPTKPGTYTLGPVSYSYFDPRSGTYQTVQTEPRDGDHHSARGRRAGQPAAVHAAGTDQRRAAGAAHHRLHAAAAGAARRARRDSARSAARRRHGTGAALQPRPVSRAARPPSSGSCPPGWSWPRCAPGGPTRCVPGARPARRLAQTLAFLRGATTAAARLQALHAWQRDAATLLGIAHAAPSSGHADRTFRFLRPCDPRPHDPNALGPPFGRRPTALFTATPTPCPTTGWCAPRPRSKPPACRAGSRPRFSSRAISCRGSAGLKPETGNRIPERSSRPSIVLFLLSGIRYPVSAMAADAPRNPELLRQSTRRLQRGRVRHRRTGLAHCAHPHAHRLGGPPQSRPRAGPAGPLARGRGPVDLGVPAQSARRVGALASRARLRARRLHAARTGRVRAGLRSAPGGAAGLARRMAVAAGGGGRGAGRRTAAAPAARLPRLNQRLDAAGGARGRGRRAWC